jgi:hypothetical protein
VCLQKAKAEHKFFAECRKSNALMEQQAAITKTLEAQRVALDKSRKVEDDLRAQLVGISFLFIDSPILIR